MVNDHNQFEEFFTEIADHDLIMDVIRSDLLHHAALSTPIGFNFYDVVTDKTYTISTGHPDSDYTVLTEDIKTRLLSRNNNIWCFDKKSVVQVVDWPFINDINLFKYLSDNVIFEPPHPNPASRWVCRNLPRSKNTGYILPLLKHRETFQETARTYAEYIKSHPKPEGYDKINTIVIETLAELEKNGICINVPCFKKHFSAPIHPLNDSLGLVYSQYNIYTSTGRPSNRYDGVNYAALNKEDASRECFVSRHPKGKLVLIDYSAFHPRIIGNLVDFRLPLDVDIYHYLGECYFNKSDLTDVDIDESKTLTFRQLYGGVEKRFEHIKYFSRLKGYVESNWDFFKQHGYVRTPIFKRHITDKHITDPNPNKLFNYILQATETELTLPVLFRLNEYLRPKKTKAVLYTYDSILFDLCPDDGIKLTLLEILKIMSMGDRFPVKVYVGNDYDNLSQISIS